MVSISLCMIVKNEEDVLARALDSVKELADEMIIVDTGSEDRTKDIAQRYTQKVFDFEWEDDFAAARNFACRKASMDYWMWLDADDIVTENELKKMKALKSEIDPDTDVVMMKYLTGFDHDGYPAVSYYRDGSETGRGSYGKAGCTKQSFRQARCCILTLRSSIIRTVQMALIGTSGYMSP